MKICSNKIHLEFFMIFVKPLDVQIDEVHRHSSTQTEGFPTLQTSIGSGADPNTNSDCCNQQSAAARHHRKINEWVEKTKLLLKSSRSYSFVCGFLKVHNEVKKHSVSATVSDSYRFIYINFLIDRKAGLKPDVCFTWLCIQHVCTFSQHICVPLVIDT